MTRLIDIILSMSALILFSPMLFIVVVILKFTGENEIFYLQNRVGFENKNFKLLKFATMLKKSSSMALGTITVKNDPRVLPFGKLLRVSKINEIPQLINVLKGDISLIGPRPQTRDCFEVFPEEAKEKLLLVKPGLSGVGSIFFRNEQEMLDSSGNPKEIYANVIMPYKADLEIWFIKNKSTKLYFALIFFTIAVIIKPSFKWQKYLPNIPNPPNSILNLLKSIG